MRGIKANKYIDENILYVTVYWRGGKRDKPFV